MSKYGLGVGMKSAMEMDMREVEAVLDKYNMKPHDRELVVEILKEAYFEWASVNAAACHFEELVKGFLDEENWTKLMRIFLVNHTQYLVDKMSETYAWYGDEPEGFKDEDDEGKDDNEDS